MVKSVVIITLDWVDTTIGSKVEAARGLQADNVTLYIPRLKKGAESMNESMEPSPILIL